MSKKAFLGGTIDYVIVQPTPFDMSYHWNKLTIQQLSEKEEIRIEEGYYPTSSGEREIRFRTVNKNIGLCILPKGIFQWLVGNELKIPFRVYSRIEILMVIGAISAIIAAVLSGIALF